jgi:O-antigen/teichoic acid export membrane protein
MIAVASVARTARVDPRQLWVAALGSAVAILSVAILGHGVTAATLLLIGAGGALLVMLTAWRPPIGCAVLALAVPLTAGLGRDTVIPLARTSEMVGALVGIGLLLHFLPRKASGSFTGMDLAIGGFCGMGVLIPWFVLFIDHQAAGIDVWRVVLAPAQYLLLYLIFSRAGLDGRSLTTVINLAMFASVLVALVGLAQLADVPGVRTFVETTFPLDGLPAPICQFGVCRPTSLLEHWSAFGGYALLNYLLALALASWRHAAFSNRWLGIVIATNAMAVLASQTQAAIIGMVLGTIVIAWHARRVPRQLRVALAGIVLGVVLFWPQVSARVQQQFFSGGGGASSPASLETRYQYWGDYFLPILADHAWTGTGTVIPSEVPEVLTTYVDNEYFRLAFRAGIIGVASLLLMLATIGMVGWRARASPEPFVGALGAASVAFVLILAVMGTTAEYLTFAGVSQQFWMVIGLFGGLLVAGARSRPAVVLPSPAPASGPTPGANIRAALLRLKPESALLRSSAIVFAGNAAARFLGLLFAVVAARLLLPTGYGFFAYALAIVNIAAILVMNAPQGLARALSRYHDDAPAQHLYFSNWLVVIGLVLALSLVLALPLSIVAGLSGPLLLGVAANLIGLTILQTYREAQRGLEQFGAWVAIYLIANLLQLFVIIAFGFGGIRDPGLFLIVYGLSTLVALLPLQLVVPLPLHFVVQTLRRDRMLDIVRFVRPLFLQTAFFAVWIGADLVLVNALMSSAAAGVYGAAKTMGNVLLLAPAAVGTGLLPRIARLPEAAVRAYVIRALALGAVLTVPPVAFLIALARPIIRLAFGSRYEEAAVPLTVLAIGVGLYSLYNILEWSWIGRGRPSVDALATGTAMVCTVATGLILIPRYGLVGAALAFTAGSALQLMMIMIISYLALGKSGSAADSVNEADSVVGSPLSP